ncbi:MAG: substrate-binding domain-containing protein, partial [Acidobacteria bacterium]|nr:substrate-binding domain-containing protein [Acidobacteriota bacterium]
MAVALAAALAAALPAAINASRAEAAFTTGACAGDALIGGGASFQNGAHVNAFIPSAFPTYCGGLGAGSTPSVTYNSRGSGCGRVLMGSREVCASGGNIDNSSGANGRNQTARFGASDEPLTVTQQSQVNQGTDAVGDEGVVRTIPVAMGSIAVIINIPTGCSVVRKPGSATDQPVGSGNTGFDSTEQAKFANFGNAQVRLKLTRAQVEAIYSGSTSLDTWGELVPWINDGNGTASETTDTRCQNWPIFRIRRVDSSGTTYAFKDWLNTIDPAEGWLTTYNTGTYKDRFWPQNTQTVAFDYNGDGDTADAVGSGAGTCASAVGSPAISPSPTFTTPSTGVGCDESAIPLLQT